MSTNKRFNIAVTGIGGGVGQSIIKSLAGTQYNIIGLDGDILGAGLYVVNKAYKIPLASDQNYINKLFEICIKENCQLLFPGLDAELPLLAKQKERFKKIGTIVVISTPEVIRICDDKLSTSLFLLEKGLSGPFTCDLKEYSINSKKFKFPLILKPRTGGARSKNVYLLREYNDLKRIFKTENLSSDNFIIQEYIDGDEYTCGTINLGGKYWGTIIMRRILRNGDTYKCFSIKNTVIENVVSKIMNALHPFGACNVQLRIRDNIPYVFEMNARCSGTTAARSIAGFNEPKTIADYILNGKRPVFHIKEMTILRYWNELKVNNDLVDTLNTKGFLVRKKHEYL
jgi:carbamoyl-phosphate synthase large subunit